MEHGEACRWLGVTRDATVAQVHRAFRAIALVSHPDHGGDSATFVSVLHARDEMLRSAAAAATSVASAPTPATTPYDMWLRLPAQPHICRYDSQRPSVRAAAATTLASDGGFAEVLAHAHVAFAA